MEKLLIFLVLIGISKLVDMLKNAGAAKGQPGDVAGRRVPAAGDPPAELGRPGGLRGLLEELVRVPAEDGGEAESGQSRPAAPVKGQKPRENGRPQRQRPAERPGQGSGERSGVQRPKAAKGGKKSGPGSGLSASTATGAGVSRHVEQAISAHVRQHVGSTIGESVRRDIDEHVEATFGRDAAGGGASGGQAGGAAGIRRILKSPGGVQQAMLVSEILNRPRIFRR